MVGKNIKKALEGKTIFQRVEDRVDDAMFNARNVPSRAIQENVPRVGQRNIGEGVGAGLVEAGIAIILEDTLGIPFGAETEVVDVEPVKGGYVYTVNVNAPTENMANARAFLDSTTGFTSILTDTLDIKSSEVLNTRMLRDTYQVEVKIED